MAIERLIRSGLPAAYVICQSIFFPAFAAPSVEDFARMPTFTDLAIAPGGKFLAARVNINNSYTAAVFDISVPGIESVYGFTENDEVSVAWFRWVSSEHLLASIAFTAERGGLRGVQTQERRLVVVDASNGDITALFRNKRDELPVQIQDHVVSYLPNDPEHILVQYSKSDPSKPNVYKINVTERASHKRVMRSRNSVLDWMADAEGDVRLGSGVRENKYAFLTMRPAGEKKWRDFSHRVNEPGIVFRPIQFTADPNKLYVASNHDGDPSGLYIFDIPADEFGELIFKHPSVDIAAVDIDDKTLELRSINFVEDEVGTKFISRRPIEELIRKLSPQFPGKSIYTRSISSDSDYAVLMAQSSNEPGGYLIFDSIKRQIKQLPLQYPGLADTPPGRTISTSYAARDGLDIPAFVTLPPGHAEGPETEEMTEIPFVIMPHGGPAARDFLRFDYWVQFLASRGYGVLQMNFRGSAGYGQAFEDAGDREWGQAMQDDISDGVTWLIDERFADPDRIAIVGGSYGGYAALMGAVKTPDLYQCAISFAGVSDLPNLLRHQRKYVAGAYSTRFIGDLWKDRKMLAENSPARKAENITVPVLLFHGDEDTIVDIDQSKKMARALRKHDKEYQFIPFKKGDHHLSLYTHRLRFLSEMETFLAHCLGAPTDL